MYRDFEGGFKEMEIDTSIEGILTFSGEIEVGEILDSIEEFILKANEDLLSRGAPPDKGAKITDWRAERNKIIVNILGSQYIRAHEALIRLVNPLSEKLGPKYHIGIRNIELKDFRITFAKEINKTRHDNIEEKISELSEIRCIDRVNNYLVLDVSSLTEEEIRSGVADRLINLVRCLIEGEEGLTEKVTKVKPGTILSKSKDRQPEFLGNITKEMEKRGWIKRFPGKGQWIYLPPYSKLFRAISEVGTDRIPKKLSFDETLLPKLIPLNVMHQMKYLEGLPEGMFYTCTPSRDDELYDLFKKELKVRNDPPIEILKQGLQDPGYVLAPAQCEAFYQLYSHQMLSEENLPIKLYDRSGFTYRWEGGGSRGLDRVNEFQRIELVWMGTPKQVDEIANNILEEYKKALDELGIGWFVEVGDDPFYLESRTNEKDEIEYPDIPKYEIRVKLPDGESLSIGSVNIHGTHFVEGFSIRSALERPLWTGCAGLGVSRWILAFLIFNGFNQKNWPEVVAKKALPMPDVPKTLEWP